MMLTELVIHKGVGSAMKNDALSKQDVKDILKFGAEDLFQDGDDSGKGLLSCDTQEYLEVKQNIHIYIYIIYNRLYRSKTQ